jgi:hypothetical protein
MLNIMRRSENITAVLSKYVHISLNNILNVLTREVLAKFTLRAYRSPPRKTVLFQMCSLVLKGPY